MTDPTWQQLVRGEALATRQELMAYLRINKNKYIQLRKAGIPCVPISPLHVVFHLPTAKKWIEENCPDRYREDCRKAREEIDRPIGRRK